MDVVVLGQRLSPGVQDHGDGGLGAEVARVERESTQGVGSDAEEQPVEQPAVHPHQRMEGVRQGEDEMEVRHGQQHRLLGRHPARGLLPLALRAVAVAAGVIRDAPLSAALALLDVATKRRCATVGDRAQHPTLGRRARMRAQVLGR